MGKTDVDAENGSVDVILPDGFGASFSDKAVRTRFIRKVYMILLSQVCNLSFFLFIMNWRNLKFFIYK